MQSNMKLLTAESWVVSKWSGGMTTQLAIAPEGAVYQNRDFLWRLSSATVELEESNFTPLPDYTRLVSTLDGGITIFPEGGTPATLSPFEVYSFDGATPIRAVGSCTDYNLMLRKGRCEGSLWSLKLHPGQEVSLSPAVPSPQRFSSRCVTLYCAKGGVEVKLGEQSAAVKAGQLLLIEASEPLLLALSCGEATDLMIAQIEF